MWRTPHRKGQKCEGLDADKQAEEDYIQSLIHCHQILTHTMKTKQATDLANVEMLKSSVEGFKRLYFADKK